MGNVIPLYRDFHVLFLENDWVIRQILIEHFAADDNCRIMSFSDVDRALEHLRLASGAQRIFSNVHIGRRGGIDLSAGSDWPMRIHLSVAPGYDAEGDRFRAIEAGLGFFRVKPYDYPDLRQRVKKAVGQTSFP